MNQSLNPYVCGRVPQDLSVLWQSEELQTNYVCRGTFVTHGWTLPSANQKMTFSCQCNSLTSLTDLNQQKQLPNHNSVSFKSRERRRLGWTQKWVCCPDPGHPWMAGREGLAFSCSHQAAASRSYALSHSCPLIRRSKTLPFKLHGSFRMERISTSAFRFHYQVNKVTAKFKHEAHFSSGQWVVSFLLLICSAANSVCLPRCLAWCPRRVHRGNPKFQW